MWKTVGEMNGISSRMKEMPCGMFFFFFKRKIRNGRMQIRDKELDSRETDETVRARKMRRAEESSGEERRTLQAPKLVLDGPERRMIYVAGFVVKKF